MPCSRRARLESQATSVFADKLAEIRSKHDQAIRELLKDARGARAVQEALRGM